jgi:hypothetical protein
MKTYVACDSAARCVVILSPHFSSRFWKGGASQAAEKLSSAYNHPGAQGATPPESGGELLKTLPSSDEEGWRAERRGGADSASAKRHRVFPQPVKPRPSGSVQPWYEARLIVRTFSYRQERLVRVRRIPSALEGGSRTGSWKTSIIVAHGFL